MSTKSKIVDLVLGEDGSYSEKGMKPSTSKGTKCTKNTKGKQIGSSKIAQEFKSKKNIEPPNVEEFFNGLDSGINFLEGISRRISRIVSLRD